MAQTRVTTQQLRGVAERVEGLAGQYANQVTALYNSGKELDSMWDGDANQTFNTKLGNDQPRFQAMSDMLKRYVQTLRDNADDYDRAEAQAVDTLNTNKIRTV